MIIIRIKLTKVDYDKLAKRFLPDAFSGETESGNLVKRLAGKLLVKDGETSALAKGMLKLIPEQTKGSMAFHLLLRNQEQLKAAMNQVLSRELKGVELQSMSVMETEKAVYDMLKLEIVLKEIDYNQVIAQLLPKLLSNLSAQGDKSEKLAQILIGMGDTPVKMLSAAFELLNQSEKDELLVQLLSIYGEDIVTNLNHMALQQNIAAEVDHIQLTRI